ncbi:MAG TPA: alpha-amylase family glycosyl hydrolase [Bacteroidales bacterium]|nr:alpha-amylase family glycosyl hydrolase [Bacteroidales bacterium]
MNKFLASAVLFLLFLLSVSGQMISTDPAVPTLGRVIKIYYDTNQDAGELHNYTGDIYVHTGLILEGSPNWQKVIGTWGNNAVQPKLNYLGNYKYEFIISPSIETFYNVLPGEKVKKIALVFRNSDGTRQTRPDIFIDVFESGLNVIFTLPERFSVVIEKNSLLGVSASATNADSISLYINNQYRKSGRTRDLVTDTIIAESYGEYWVKAVAWDLPRFAADSFFCHVRKSVEVEELPPGAIDGINYINDTSVILVLHAPYKNYVFATGDFTDWLACSKGYMKRTPDSERYWVRIDGLEPKKEYRFQYFVDGELYIADPYADKILDPFNDDFITESTYPGLIKYPKGITNGMVSVLQTAQNPYKWKNEFFNAPPPEKLVIYELLLRDFVASHDFKTLTDTLNYLKNLGINAVELMPVTEFEGNLSWGYNVAFYFAPDKYYGPKEYFKAFVDSCHGKGIAVIMDLVLNHCFGQSPFVQLYLDHYGAQEIVMKTPNPWFNSVSPNPVYKWGADFNHEAPATQKLVDRITSYWLTEYKIDGFRFDFTKGFTNTPGEGWTYDASRIAILKRIAGKIWEVNPSAYVILEHFTENAEEKELAEYGMLIWGNLNYQFAEAVMGYDSDLSGATHIARGWKVPNLVSYMESHDEERIMYKALAYGASAPDYNVKNLQTALRRMELAAVFLLSIPGPKMIWQFGELGYDISIDYNGRTGEKPLLWNYFSIPERRRLYRVYSVMNNLRQTCDAFSNTFFTYSLSGKQKSIILGSQNIKAYIVGNFDISTATFIPLFPQTGKWYEYFSDDSLTVNSFSDPLTLRPGEYRIYTTVRLPSPKEYLGVQEILDNELISVNAYPNPSKDQFYFTLNTKLPGLLTLTIYNSTGNTIWQKKMPALNEFIVEWDGKDSRGNDIPAGIYFVHVRNGKYYNVIKIVKLN